MRHFKQVALSVVSFLCVVVLLSSVSLALYFDTEIMYYVDGKLRRSLAGTIDFLVIGSSTAWNGIVPQILDEKLGVNSYLVAGGILPIYAKRLLLEKELERNPVKTVIIEIAFDTMTRNSAEDNYEGDEVALSRLESFEERWNYIRAYLNLDGTVKVLTQALLHGVQCVVRAVTGNIGVDYTAKGYRAQMENDVQMSSLEIDTQYHSTVFRLEGYIGTNGKYKRYWPANIDCLSSMIQLCRDYGAEPIVVSVPMSMRILWPYAEMDTYRLWLNDYCEEQNIAHYDFNLLKSRHELLSERSSFYNPTHLSGTGSQTLTGILADTLKMAENGEDVSGLFYDSYADMIQDSPYMKIYLENKSAE